MQALDVIDHAGSASARVEATVEMLQALGYAQILVTLRDPSLNVTLAVGRSDGAVVMVGDGMDGAALQAMPGAVWRRRLAQLEKTGAADLHLLDGGEAWVAREFFAADPVDSDDLAAWRSTDLIVGILRGASQELLGIVELAGPTDGRRPTEARQAELTVLLRHLAARLAFDGLHHLAQRRAERLQRLQEAGAAMARSLDETAILRELARHAFRATGAEGVVIGVPDLEADRLDITIRLLRGSERPRGSARLGQGIVAEAVRTGMPVRIGDRVADREREKAGRPSFASVVDVVGEYGPAASVLVVPLLSGIQLLGVLAVHTPDAEVFSAEDEEVLATMASQAATAVANARRYAESEREARQSEALADVARAVGESLRLGEVLRLILRHTVALLHAEGACLALRKDEYLHIVAAHGAADVLAGVHLPIGSSIMGAAVLEEAAVVSNNLRDDPRVSRTIRQMTQIQRTAVAPLMTAKGTIGALCVLNRAQPFTDDDTRILQRLADQVAVAVVNARLFEEVERATREWKVAFDAIATGMAVLDDMLRVRRCNARAAELCNLTIPGLLETSLSASLFGHSAAARAELEGLVQRSLNMAEPVRDVVRDPTDDRLFECVVSPHPDGGCIVTFDDVTAMHRLIAQASAA